MLRMHVAGFLIFVALHPAAVYLRLSVVAGRPLTLQEAHRLVGGILLNTLTRDQDAIPRAHLLAAAEVAVQPPRSDPIEGAPPLTGWFVAGSEAHLVTFADNAALAHYYVEALPAAGWRLAARQDGYYRYERPWQSLDVRLERKPFGYVHRIRRAVTIE